MSEESKESGRRSPSASISLPTRAVSVTLFEDVGEVLAGHQEEIEAVKRGLDSPSTPPDDVVVYRFLRGYRFNVETATKRLNATLQWRKENNIDTIRAKVLAQNMVQKDFPFYDKLIKCYPHNIHHGHDRSGQPLSLERFGHVHPGALVRLVRLEELMEYHLYHMEFKAHMISRLSKEQGRVMRVAKVMDLRGLSSAFFNRQGVSYLKKLITLSQDHYPEMLGTLYIINAPWLFMTCWKIVKPWLQPATLEKIHMLGSNYREALLQHIDADQLPEWAGGTCTSCPDGCVTEVDADEGLTEVVVARRGKFDVHMCVEEGNFLSWEFHTVSSDIGFAAYFFPGLKLSDSQAQNEKSTEDVQSADTVVSSSRVNAHKEHMYGSYKAHTQGLVLLRWDNTYSRIYSKTLLYRADVVSLDRMSSGDSLDRALSGESNGSS